MRPIPTKPFVLLHLTLKTRNSPRLDVGFMEKSERRLGAGSPDNTICLVVNEGAASIIRFSPITGFAVRLIA